MARPERILTLNLGMQTVQAAVFELLPDGGLHLASLASRDLIVDPAADATRDEQIKTVVAELREELSVRKNERANLCLPSQAVFSRFVKLPGNTPQDVEEIIAFEAQQNVPFPIDEVVWDHQIIGDKRNDAWDVSLLAIKTDQLSSLANAIAHAGLRAATIDVAPMALYNSLHYNYADVTGCTLLIDLGARTTNLVFSDSNRVFTRSIPIGGSNITAAVAKEFSLDITAAEQLKIEKGSVGLGGAYAESEDANEARIAKVVRNSMTRLHAEVARSINFYRTSQGGTTPTRILICGGGSNLTYMAEFFTEKLQAPVEFFNPLRNITLAEDALRSDNPPCASGIGELAGTALRALGDCPIEINLTPPSVAREQDLARRRPQLVLAALFLIATPAIAWLHLDHRATAIEAQAASLQQQVGNLSSSKKQLDALAKQLTAKEAEAAPLLAAASTRAAWTTILEALSANLPTRFIWITAMEPLAGTPAPPDSTPQATKATHITGIEIQGLYLGDPPNARETAVIDEFADNLAANASSIFTIDADRTKVVTQRSTPDPAYWAHGYTMRLPLAQPIPLAAQP
jgi:type IV pilus assembly protein PilM